VIKLTNATDQYKGNAIYINPEWIVAVFSTSFETGGSLKTIVYGGPQGTSWEVEESPEEIHKLLSE
jgi:hypothetical protein